MCYRYTIAQCHVKCNKRQFEMQGVPTARFELSIQRIRNPQLIHLSFVGRSYALTGLQTSMCLSLPHRVLGVDPL